MSGHCTRCVLSARVKQTLPVKGIRYPLLTELREIEVYDRSSNECVNNQINNNSHHKKATRWVASFEMVGRAGFEPATNWLKANCSTD